MKELINKNKKEIIMVAVFFLLYFILGTYASYYLKTYKYWNVFYDFDTPRVFGDLSLFDYNHYRTSVHPLFVIIFQPIVKFISLFLKDKVISVILLQSILASLSVLIFNKCLKKILKNNNCINVLTIFFALSFGQIAFTMFIETYIFAQFLLILMWYYGLLLCDKKLNFNNYLILVLLGIGALSVTITNFAQYIIMIFFIITCNKKIDNRIIKSFVILFLVGSISVFLADIQNLVWNSAPNFFEKGVTDFFNKSSEESLYITHTLGKQNFINVFNALFSYSFNMGKLYIPATGIYITFQNSIIANFISVTLMLVFITLNIIFIKQTKFNIMKNKMYYAILLALLFNIGLHLFYGNSISFLYVCHFNYLIMFLIAYLINYYKVEELFDNKKIKFLSIVFIVLTSLKSILTLIVLLAKTYNTINYFRIMPLAIVLLLGVFIIMLMFKKNLYKIISAIILIVIVVFSWMILNKKINLSKTNEFGKYKESYDKYIYQLTELKNDFNIKTFADTKEKIGIFYFGMADRKKILYKKGQLIDIESKEVIKSVEYKDELIVPNEYTVVLKTKDNKIITIYENEEGVFYSDNGNIETITKGNKKINLPKYEDKKYSEVLKVLLQEVLFNIKGDLPVPNIFGYKTAWYRDTMLGTMVLEDTNNTLLLEEWVNSIDKIYDLSRNPEIEEADNLGELLYILGAIKNDRSDLVQQVLDEISDKRNDDGSISGMVDGVIQTYYPTAVAIHGMRKLGIEPNLTLPQTDDAYAKLTWYMDERIPTTLNQTSQYYPYLNWAFYHYSPYTPLYILDEIYPLSYEAGDLSTPGKVENECFVSEYYCEKQLYLAHMWHASEMYLYLKDFKSEGI